MSPLIFVEPDAQQKLAILSVEADVEATAAPAVVKVQQGIRHPAGFIYAARKEGGGTARLFETLQTNDCRFACRYCFTSCAVRRWRTTFRPDEPATTFISLHRARQVDGLFLRAAADERGHTGYIRLN